MKHRCFGSLWCGGLVFDLFCVVSSIHCAGRHEIGRRGLRLMLMLSNSRWENGTVAMSAGVGGNPLPPSLHQLE